MILLKPLISKLAVAKRSFSITHKLLKPAEALSSIKSVVGNTNVSTTEGVCDQHDHDESMHRGKKPYAVVWPQSTEEVSEIMKICNQYKYPVIPFGTGSGLEGGVVPLLDGSISLNLTNMDKILHLNTDDLCVTVEPGVTRKYLNQELRSTGLWFPIDPGADASVCGMAATGASGTNAVRYGTIKQNVLNMEVVLPNGEILYTSGKGQHCLKRSSGYNLTELFIGSEGTLGVITSVTTKLHGIPEFVLSAVCPFPSIQDAVSTAIQIKQFGIPIARMELVDKNTLIAMNEQNKLDLELSDCLFFEFHGSETTTKEQVEIVREISDGNGAGVMSWAEKVEDRNKLWQARHDVYYSSQRMKAGHSIVITDVCVPISKLPDIIDFSVARCKQDDILHTLVGHIGDGNFHSMLVVDPNDKQAVLCAKQAASDMSKKAIELGGTCTGEHGVGIGKKHLLLQECGEVGLNLMKSLKNVIDPNNIMNPGKLL